MCFVFGGRQMLYPDGWSVGVCWTLKRWEWDGEIAVIQNFGNWVSVIHGTSLGPREKIRLVIYM